MFLIQLRAPVLTKPLQKNQFLFATHLVHPIKNSHSEEPMPLFTSCTILYTTLEF